MSGCSMPNISVILVFMGVLFGWRKGKNTISLRASLVAIGYSANSLPFRSEALQKAVRKLRVASAEHGEWTAASSAELYGIRNWGADYFDINEAGEVVVRVPAGDGAATVSLMDIIRGMQQRGMTMPVLLRLDNLLEAQIALLNNSFAKAIQTLGYKSEYRGVFPIKVNQ